MPDQRIVFNRDIYCVTHVLKVKQEHGVLLVMEHAEYQ
jgi:hypothetical protein